MRDRKAIVVSDEPTGIVGTLAQAGFQVSVLGFEQWEGLYEVYDNVHMVVLDEVNRLGRNVKQQTEISNAEEALKQNAHGPFVVILVGDDDRHLTKFVDFQEFHPRQIAHIQSHSLLSLAEQLCAASGQDNLAFSD